MNEREPDNQVEPSDACPACGERDADLLAWQDDGTVACQICGKVYMPTTPA